MDSVEILDVDGSRVSSRALYVGRALAVKVGLIFLVVSAAMVMIALETQRPLPREALLICLALAFGGLLVSAVCDIPLRPADAVGCGYALALAQQDSHIAGFIERMYPNGGVLESRDVSRITRYAAAKGHKAQSRAGAGHIAAPANDVPPFDYATASQNDLFFRYYRGDVAHISVGRPDWMPVTAFMLLAAGEGGETVLLNAFEAKAGVGRLPGAPKWCRDTFAAMVPQLTQLQDLDMPRISTGCLEGAAQEGYEGLTSIEAYDAFLVAWGSCQGVTGGAWLASSDRRIAYLGLPELEAHRHAVEDLGIATMKWAAEWLVSSGMQVEMPQQLVHVPGYAPLVNSYVDMA